MSYVFDNSPLSVLFKNFYRSRFPSLWERFDTLVADGQIASTREAYREIEDGPTESLRAWALENRHLFATPTAVEGASSLASMPSVTFSKTSSSKRF